MNDGELEIAEPCKVDWRKMTPRDGGGRFCGDCKKVVKDLSSMTEREARKLLRSANDGQLCVRFLHDAHGNVFFGADAPQPDFVPASMLSRAKRAVAMAGFALATQACVSENEATDEEKAKPQLYETMGGMVYTPDRFEAPDASSSDGAADGGTDAERDADAGAPVEPN